MLADLLVHDIARLYTLDSARPRLGQIEGASVAFTGGEVSWVGPSNKAPDARTRIDGTGLIGLPGLVDPHTHTIFAGSRSGEFESRLEGMSYSEILEAGGGILSTVRATRAADLDELTTAGRQRLRRMRARGVTTVEIKSGYGLEVETEARMLQAARACDDVVRVVTTFLGAHTFPLELRGDREAYVDQVITEQLPRCAPLAECIDVYCDQGAFTVEESLRILRAGKELGLVVRVHAEQIAYTGIAERAAALGAASADHLERLDEDGARMMAECGTVAVLLPGAQLYLRDEAPPVEMLRRAGVAMAVGTDLNPGSSPLDDLWTAATLSTLIQGLTVEEAILGITRNAGLALGRKDLGWIGRGSVGDLALFAPPPGQPPTAASLVQFMGGHTAAAVIRDGRRIV